MRHCSAIGDVSPAYILLWNNVNALVVLSALLFYAVLQL
jgi:hypothetical protein